MRFAPKLALLGALALVWGACTERMHAPVPSPERDPSTRWAALLGRAAGPAGTDYDLIEEHREILDAYVAWVGEHGPASDDLGESAEDERIAYMANAYNALVIFGVLAHRPIQSVRDVKVGVWRRPGAGFFFAQRFKVDTEWLSLHNLERQYIVDRYQEPLLHVALNCGSAGCPPVKYWPSRGLQNHLTRAMREFLGSERGLRWDGTQLLVSEILADNAADFTDWSHHDDLCGYLSDYATGTERAWLLDHVGACQLGTFPYDWRLNDADAPEGFIPDLEAPEGEAGADEDADSTEKPPRRKVVRRSQGSKRLVRGPDGKPSSARREAELGADPIGTPGPPPPVVDDDDLDAPEPDAEPPADTAD